MATRGASFLRLFRSTTCSRVQSSKRLRKDASHRPASSGQSARHPTNGVAGFGSRSLAGRNIFQLNATKAPVQEAQNDAAVEPLALPTSDESPELLRIRHSVSGGKWLCQHALPSIVRTSSRILTDRLPENDVFAKCDSFRPAHAALLYRRLRQDAHAVRSSH